MSDPAAHVWLTRHMRPAPPLQAGLAAAQPRGVLRALSSARRAGPRGPTAALPAALPFLGGAAAGRGASQRHATCAAAAAEPAEETFTYQAEVRARGRGGRYGAWNASRGSRRAAGRF